MMKRFLFILSLSFILLLESAVCVFVTCADEESYTSVMSDLTQDSSFDASAYPMIADDYGLYLIQIAEDADGSLYLYVYQPSHYSLDLTATSVRLGTPTVGVNTQWFDYPVSLVSTCGVFDKYVVDDFVVSSDASRYYDIVCLHRAYCESVDGSFDDQTVTDIAIDVSQLWRAETDDFGAVSYTMQETETIEITNKIVGYIVYNDDCVSLPFFYVNECHSHFVAFSTDHDIDRLIAVDVSFNTQSCTYNSLTSETTLGESVLRTITITADSSAGNDADGIMGKQYTWQRIESIDDFLANETEDLNLNDTQVSSLADMQYILRFYETDYNVSTYTYTDADLNVIPYTIKYSTFVSDVTILRMYFETDGVTYNLGVIDHKTTGANDAFANADTVVDDLIESLQDGFAWVKLLIAFVVFLLILSLLAPILTPVVRMAIDLVFAPFELLRKILRKK